MDAGSSSQFVFAIGVAAAVAAITAHFLRLCLAGAPHQARPDAAFWCAFSGGFTLLSVMILAAVGLPAGGAAVVLASLLFAGLALGWIWRGEHERNRRRRADAYRNAMDGLLRRHAELLQAWVSYELDPARAIDFPAMTDVRQPGTAELVRAMRHAARQRSRLGQCAPERTTGSVTDFTAEDARAATPATVQGYRPLEEYEASLAALEDAVRRAEAAAGVRRGESAVPEG